MAADSDGVATPSMISPITMKMMTLNGSRPASALSLPTQFTVTTFSSAGASEGLSRTLIRQAVTNSPASNNPGRMPAIKRDAMETSARVPTMIARMLGGMIGARQAPARMVPIDSRVS